MNTRKGTGVTLSLLLLVAALLWCTPLIWMFSASVSATTFGPEMASLVPSFPLSFQHFIDAWELSLIHI